MSGHVTTVVGPMFASKSTELLRYLNRAIIANRPTVLFKPRIDNRYSTDEVVTHDGNSLSATVVDSHKEILDHVAGADVIGIDEIQFFDTDVWRVVNTLASNGRRVVVAGLGTDFMGNPFETTARVAMISEKVVNLTAVCVKCGEDAVWTQMVINGEEVTDGDRVQVGGSESYEPRCRLCFVRR